MENKTKRKQLKKRNLAIDFYEILCLGITAYILTICVVELFSGNEWYETMLFCVRKVILISVLWFSILVLDIILTSFASRTEYIENSLHQGEHRSISFWRKRRKDKKDITLKELQSKLNIPEKEGIAKALILGYNTELKQIANDVFDSYKKNMNKTYVSQSMNHTHNKNFIQNWNDSKSSLSYLRNGLPILFELVEKTLQEGIQSKDIEWKKVWGKLHEINVLFEVHFVENEYEELKD